MTEGRPQRQRRVFCGAQGELTTKAGGAQPAFIRNVSLGGALAEVAPSPVQVGDTAQLLLKLPGISSLLVRGSVRYVSPQGSPMKVGVRFDSLGAMEHGLLSRWIGERLAAAGLVPPPQPAERQGPPGKSKKT